MLLREQMTYVRIKNAYSKKRVQQHVIFTNAQYCKNTYIMKALIL